MRPVFLTLLVLSVAACGPAKLTCSDPEVLRVMTAIHQPALDSLASIVSFGAATKQTMMKQYGTSDPQLDAQWSPEAAKQWIGQPPSEVVSVLARSLLGLNGDTLKTVAAAWRAAHPVWIRYDAITTLTAEPKGTVSCQAQATVGFNGIPISDPPKQIVKYQPTRSDDGKTVSVQADRLE